MIATEVWGARSAMIGGTLRIVASFVPYTPESVTLETFYAIIDVFLLFGLFAIFGRFASQFGRVAPVGLMIGIIGQASIVGPDAVMFGMDFYLAGMGVLLAGLGLASAAMMWTSTMRAVAACWLGCIALAIAATIAGSSVLVTAAGVAFGLGFVLAGRALLST